MRHALSLLPVFALFACGPKMPPEAPINSADQMCCMKGDVSSGKFGGCVQGRKNRQCDEEHPLWIRGVISCGPVDEASCLGGRCCEFGQAWGQEDSSLDWDPPGEDEVKGTPVEESTPSEDTQPALTDDPQPSPDAEEVQSTSPAGGAPSE